MTWLGKIFGALAGWVIAGPFGFVVGLLIGHYFDLGMRITPASHDRKHVQEGFFIATFSIMGHIAKADGRVSEEEIEVARAVMRQLGLNEAQRRDAINLFTLGKQERFNLDKAVEQLLQCCRAYSDLLRVFIEIQFQAAYADGMLSPEERRILKLLCHRLGFSTIDFFTMDNQFRAQHAYQRRKEKGEAYEPKPQETLQHAYKILGVSPNVRNEELKKAYRRLLSQHHPDKLVAKGLPESLIKLANEKTHQIKEAYDRIRTHRGF